MNNPPHSDVYGSVNDYLTAIWCIVPGVDPVLKRGMFIFRK